MFMIKPTARLSHIALTLLLSISVAAKAATLEETTILRQGYILHQLWALANNYAVGTTVHKSPIKAYAYAWIYSQALPANYPGKKALLDSFKEKLNHEDLKLAKDYIKSASEAYRLKFHFDEKKLYRLFELKRETVDYPPPTEKAFKGINDFLATIKDTDSDFYQKVIASQHKKSKHTMVYGQIHLEGSEPVDMVVSNPSLLVSQDGFFFGHSAATKVVFNFPGFQGHMNTINPEDKYSNLGHIFLKRASTKNRANLVGRIAPLGAVSNTDIVLRLAASHGKKSAYLTPMIPITRLSDGQFYVKDLAANRYELSIKYKEKLVTKVFTLHAGNYKALPVIYLN